MNTRRYPRTMQEAFGPYTSRHVHVDAPRSSLRAWAVYLAVLALAIAGAMLAGCTKAEAASEVSIITTGHTQPDEYGVVCYRAWQTNGISCVKVK